MNIEMVNQLIATKQLFTGFENLSIGYSSPILLQHSDAYSQYFPKHSRIFKTGEHIGIRLPIKYHFLWHVKFHTMEILVNENFLILQTKRETESLKQFCHVCMDFVLHHNNHLNSKNIEKTTQQWYEHWKTLIGNKETNTASYDVLAELLVLEYFAKNHAAPIESWRGAFRASQDIHVKHIDETIEVKSTIIRNKYEINISSEDQMYNLSRLIFVEMEPVQLQGESINFVVERLKQHYGNISHVEDGLEMHGLHLGNPERNEQYKVHECLEYTIDSNFPKITHNSFKDNQLPIHIVKLQYTINLTGLPSKKLKFPSNH